MLLIKYYCSQSKTCSVKLSPSQSTEVFGVEKYPSIQRNTFPNSKTDKASLFNCSECTLSSPEQDSFRVLVQYLGQEVVRQQVSGSDVRILYLPTLHCPPSSIPQGTTFPRVSLPEPLPSLGQGEELQALHTLLPFMEKGVVLTATKTGVYGKRFCQGRVFWTGPHSQRGLHKMERNTEPVLLFSKDTFKQQMELFCAQGGERPQCSFTLCFGEELTESDDSSKKLIIVQIELPWAEQQVENFESIMRSINLFQTLADQSPTTEFTLHLEPVPSEA
uniref:Interferon regulatory factor 9 n=1 Tax=Neogobius melanostomus TaxID=47308 RepID=A0A8C6SIR9_9GOBI